MDTCAVNRKLGQKKQPSAFRKPVALLSDEDGRVCGEYGVWVEKSMYGKKYMGIERSTFLIDGSGTVRKVWHKVKVPGHSEEVLAAIRES